MAKLNKKTSQETTLTSGAITGNEVSRFSYSGSNYKISLFTQLAWLTPYVENIVNGWQFPDGSAVDSVDWLNRKLLDSSGNDSVDWGGRNLYDGGSITSIDFESRALYDSSNAASINYDSRTLANGATQVIWNWTNAVFSPAWAIPTGTLLRTALSDASTATDVKQALMAVITDLYNLQLLTN